MFDVDAQEVQYSTFLGSTAHDYCWGVHIGTEVVIAGSTQSASFPILNAYQETKAGDYDAYICTFEYTIQTSSTSETSTSTTSESPTAQECSITF